MPRSRDQRDDRRGGGGGFQYRERNAEDFRRRANQSGGAYDGLFRSDIDVISIKEGDWRLRILPPTWEDADDFGVEIFVHFGVGGDNQKYLCLNKMKGLPCPVCEERERASAAGESDEQYLRSLQPTKRVLAWVINRDERNGGPQLWNMSWTMDRDINRLCIDRETGRALCIDHPDDGYDLEFTVAGTGLKTKYSGTQVSRRSTPLSNTPEQQEEWLAFIQENKLPDMLQFFEYDHIKRQLTAAPRARRDDADDDTGRDACGGATRAERGRARDVDDDDRGGRRARDMDDDDGDERRPAGRQPARSRDDDDAEADDRQAERRQSDRSRGDDPPPRSRRGDDDDDAPPPRSRSRRDDDEPARGGRTRDAEPEVDDEPEPAPVRSGGAAAGRRRLAEEPADDAPVERRPLRERVAEGRRRAN